MTTPVSTSLRMYEIAATAMTKTTKKHRMPATGCSSPLRKPVEVADNVNFTTGENHVAGARTNAECSTCHVGGDNNQLTVAKSHDISGMETAKGLLAVRVNGASIDPTNSDVQIECFVDQSG